MEGFLYFFFRRVGQCAFSKYVSHCAKFRKDK